MSEPPVFYGRKAINEKNIFYKKMLSLISVTLGSFLILYNLMNFSYEVVKEKEEYLAAFINMNLGI